MDKRAKNSCSTPIPGDTVKDYSLPLSRIDSTSSDNKSNPRQLIFNRKRKRRTVNDFVRFKSVRFLDSDADTEDSWVTDWEEALDSRSKNAETSHDKRTSESTDDSTKSKDSQRKIILKKPTITRKSRYFPTEGTSKVRGISKESKKYTSPELIRDAVHVDNLFLEKFDQPLAGTSNHHSQKYTFRINDPINSREEDKRCKGDEILPVDKLPLQLPSALHYSSSDESPILPEFVKHGDWKTYEKRPAVANKRKEIPSKNKTITQTETIKWIYPKYWLSTANRLWNKFKELYSSSANDTSATESESLTHENSYNDVTSDTSESLNTSSQTENHIQEKQQALEDDIESNAMLITKRTCDKTHKKGMFAVKKILKRNYKKAIPVTDDDDSVLELEIKKRRRKIQKTRKVNPKIEKRNDYKYLGGSKLSDVKDNPRFFKWQWLEEEEDGPWRYDWKNSKVRTELKSLENISLESQYDVGKRIKPVVNVSNNNRKPSIVSVEKITTRYVLVSGQSQRVLGSQSIESK